VKTYTVLTSIVSCLFNHGESLHQLSIVIKPMDGKFFNLKSLPQILGLHNNHTNMFPIKVMPSLLYCQVFPKITPPLRIRPYAWPTRGMPMFSTEICISKLTFDSFCGKGEPAQESSNGSKS